jgi:hypothetical protein
MKKHYTLFLLFSVLVSAAFAGGSLLTVSGDSLIISTMAIPGEEYTVSLNATNQDNISRNLKWRYTSLNLPAAWESTLCDKSQCYSITSANFTTIRTATLLPGENSIVKWGVSPFCTAGAGNADMIVWLEGDSANTVQTLFCRASVTLDASCTVSSPDRDVEAGFKIFPNPATDIISLSGLDIRKETKVEVYNMIGKLQHQRFLASGVEPSINISSLSPGIYMLKVYRDGKSIMTRTFNKVQ